MILMHEDKMIAGLVPEEGGGGGHVIQDASGTAVAQEPTMQFADSHVSDDSTNDKTVIENIKSVTEAQFESATEDGLYDVDVEGAEIGEISEDYVEVEAGSGDTFGALLNELFALIDITKVNERSVLTIASDIFYPRRIQDSVLIFSGFRVLDTNAYYESAYIKSSESSLYLATYTKSSGSWNIDDETQFEVERGKKFTLYYGNDKAVVDLQTTANRCLMSDGMTTVEQALQNINSKNISNEFTQSCEYFAAFLSGNTVSLEFKCSAGTYTNGQTLITIPAKYKPKALQISPIYDYLTGGVQDASAWAKGTTITLYYRGTAITNAFAATITYII